MAVGTEEAREASAAQLFCSLDCPLTPMFQPVVFSFVWAPRLQLAKSVSDNVRTGSQYNAT